MPKKAKEYAIQMHKKCEELHGHKCTISDMYYRNADIQLAFEMGWDEALKSQWISTKEKLPIIYQPVLKLFFDKDVLKINKTTYMGEKEWFYDKDKIIAWMPIPSFDKILENNKDVLKRLKDK